MSSFATRVAGCFLAIIVGDVLRVRRRHVEQAMRRAGIVAAGTVARRMYMLLGRGLFELLFMSIAPRRLLSTVQIPDWVGGKGRLPKRGLVVATAHTGNWDLVACAVARSVPLTVVTKHFRIAWLDRLWQAVRATRGVRLVSAGDAAPSVAKALARGEFVAMIVDQRPERARAVTETSFLGAPVQVDLAPALMAMRARVPLVAAFPMRTANGHRVEIAGVIEPPARQRRQWAETAMRQVTAWLERFVLDNPEQWLWMHRRWRRLEPGEGSRRLPACPESGIGAA